MELTTTQWLDLNMGTLYCTVCGIAEIKVGVLTWEDTICSGCKKDNEIPD